jgi:nicotinamidase-related amidase
VNRPSFYYPNGAGDLYLPRYALIQEEVRKLRKEFNTAVNREKIALFLIDPQVGFCTPGASLYVDGAEKDIEQICDFIYRNLEQIDEIWVSLDTHTVFQIHTPGFWVNDQNENPDPFTMITLENVKAKKWKPYAEWIPLELIESYLEQLEQSERYILITWEYHTQKGSVDNAVVPILYETLFFYSLMTGKEIKWFIKGESPWTENYSVFSPEVQNLYFKNGSMKIAGKFDEKLMIDLMGFDRLYVAGEALSHCVKATLEDMLTAIQEEKKRIPNKLLGFQESKVYILEDCMSSVQPTEGSPDFPAIAKEALKKFKLAGMKVVKSTDDL